MTERVNLAEKLTLFADYWKPRTVARFNECDIMVVKVKGSSYGTSMKTLTTSSSS
jgi:hypothetical protein